MSENGEELIPEPQDAASARFPFFMVLTGIFLDGTMFLGLNAPLLYLLVTDCTPLTLKAYLLKLDSVPASLKDASALAFSMAILGCLLTGGVLVPAEQFFRSVCLGIHGLWHVWRKSGSQTFSRKDLLHSEYVPLVSWLVAHPAKKSHWEWELFLHNIAWSIAVNFTIAAILFAVVISSGMLWQVLLVASALWACHIAVQKSIMMKRVHEHYLEEWRRVRAGATTKG